MYYDKTGIDKDKGCITLRGKGMLTYMTVEDYQRARLAGKEPVLIDVREKTEFAGSHIPGALNMPLLSLSRDVMTELPDKKTPIVIYCDVGIRQHHAARLLRSLGYERVAEMQGGMVNYSRMGQEMRPGLRPS
jgi:rhodanese-related sulfurtransferase